MRRQVVEMAADTLRPSAGRSPERTRPGDHGHADTDLYLALLQDQLPVYVRAMMDLRAGIGQGSVRDSLLPVARATFDFYCQVLGAKVKIIADPDQLVRLRERMRGRGLARTPPGSCSPSTCARSRSAAGSAPRSAPTRWPAH